MMLITLDGYHRKIHRVDARNAKQIWDKNVATDMNVLFDAMRNYAAEVDRNQWSMTGKLTKMVTVHDVIKHNADLKGSADMLVLWLQKIYCVLTNQECHVVYQHDHHYSAFQKGAKQQESAKQQETAKPAETKGEKKGKKK